MEEFATIKNAQELFEFLFEIPLHIREQLSVDVFEDYDHSADTFINVEATQIFEDGMPISELRISKTDC